MTRLPDPVDAISPQAEATLRATVAEKGIDMELYDVAYLMDEEAYTVALSYKHKKPGLRGSDPVHKDYEIVISRDDHSVIRFSVAR